MTALKIPQLNLFNHNNNRKSTHHNNNNHNIFTNKTYTAIQHNAQGLIRSHRTDKQYLSRSRSKQIYNNNNIKKNNKNILTSPQSYDNYNPLGYQYNHLYYEPTLTATLLSSKLPYNNTYKQIADNYLNYKPMMMLNNTMDSIVKHNNNHSSKGSPYKYKAMKDYQKSVLSGSPNGKYKYNNTCECQDQHQHQGNNNNNGIKGLYNHKNNININANRQVRIQKDPYLAPTFREHLSKNINTNKYNNMNMNTNNNSANNSFIDNLNKIQNRDQIRQVSNYFISNNSNRSNLNNINMNNNNNNNNKLINNNCIQRLKTNQSSQQDNQNRNNTNNINNNIDNNTPIKPTLSSTSMQTQVKNVSPLLQKRRRDPILIQKILQQQQFALQHLCLSLSQDQHNYEICFNDLQMTKDIIMEKSKDILVKLNDCVDEKVTEVRNDKSTRMGSVFGMLNVE